MESDQAWSKSEDGAACTSGHTRGCDKKESFLMACTGWTGYIEAIDGGGGVMDRCT
jgi:hypothetical protein